MPFNIESVRNVNTLKLIAPKECIQENDVANFKGMQNYRQDDEPANSKSLVNIFEARTKGPVSLDAALNQSSLEGEFKLPLWGDILANVMFNSPPALDYPRKFSYLGSRPLKLSFPCYLILEDSVEKDLINPVVSLMSLFLPSRKKYNANSAYSGMDVNVTDMFAPDRTMGKIVDNIASIIGKIAKHFAPEFAAQLGDDVVKNVFGDVYLLEVPFPYRPMYKGTSSLILRWGKMRLEQVVVTGVTLSIPMLTYEEGYPDHIGVDISIETLRPATTDTYKNIFIL